MEDERRHRSVLRLAHRARQPLLVQSLDVRAPLQGLLLEVGDALLGRQRALGVLMSEGAVAPQPPAPRPCGAEPLELPEPCTP